MTKLCSAFFKYENNMKIGWEKYRTVLKCTEMRARVEIVDVLGWNKSVIGILFCGIEVAYVLLSLFFIT